MAKNSIFLSGWEYNRLVVDDPFAPRISALPAEVLWSGSSIFWLFENVYCTKESLDTELEARKELGWTTGEIFKELREEGCLVTYDWNQLRNDSPERYQNLKDIHDDLRKDYDEHTIISILEDGDTTELESIKLKLLSPILEELHCVQHVSPNSIKQWFQKKKSMSSDDEATQRVISGLDLIARYIQEPIRLGVGVCDPPGTGVDKKDVMRQQKVEKDIQKPLIPSLCIGNLPYADYMREHTPFIEDFRPIDKQLYDNWKNSKKNLLQLRKRAARNLWSDLHNDWIPRLEEEPEFYHEFKRLVKMAIDRARLGPLIEAFKNRSYIDCLSAAGAYFIIDIAKQYGVPMHLLPVCIAPIVGLREAVLEMRREDLKKVENLTIFYQGALAILGQQ